MNQPNTAAGNHHLDRPPAFRVVLRGYDRDEVDEYLPQLRLSYIRLAGEVAHVEAAPAASRSGPRRTQRR